MSNSPNTVARERVLNIAEEMFRDRGYNAVSMQDLAKALSMQKASLYHHVPGGKEALFVEVMERVLNRYRDGLENVIRQNSPSFEVQLQAAANWLLENPSLHYERMMQSDMPAISPESAERLTWLTRNALLKPLEAVFAPEMNTRGLDSSKASYLAGAFLAAIESIHNLPRLYTTASRQSMASFLIDVLFRSFGRG